MEFAEPFIQKINVVLGVVVAVLTYFLGRNWFLFAGFLLLNIFDWITGWIKGKLTGHENSSKGAKGVLKKIGYWIMILLSFGMSALFVELGKMLNIDLEITTLLGWFVLASLIINEIRSIIENLVESGYNVPKVLTKGLEVAEKAINEHVEDGILHIDTSDPEKDKWNFEVNVPLEEIANKDHIVLKVNSSGDSRELHSL